MKSVPTTRDPAAGPRRNASTTVIPIPKTTNPNPIKSSVNPTTKSRTNRIMNVRISPSTVPARASAPPTTSLACRETISNNNETHDDFASFFKPSPDGSCVSAIEHSHVGNIFYRRVYQNIDKTKTSATMSENLKYRKAHCRFPEMTEPTL